jgi:hypothetical protein
MRAVTKPQPRFKNVMKPKHDPLERVFAGARNVQAQVEGQNSPPGFSTNVLRALRHPDDDAVVSIEPATWERLSLVAIPVGALIALVSLLLAAFQTNFEGYLTEPESIAIAVINETIAP